MVTVHREAGYRFVIFSDDHEPAHVHVTGNGIGKINLAGADGLPELVYAGGITGGEIRKVMQIVRKQQAFFMKRWSDIHG